MAAITAMTAVHPAAGQPGRTRRTRAQARQEILRAAGTVFVELGYDAASLDEIAQRVGVTRTGVLYHFHSKEALLLGVVAPLLVDTEELLARTAPADEPTSAQRREVVGAMFDLFVRHRHAAELIVGHPSTVATLDIGPVVARYGAELAARLGGAAYRTDPNVRLRVATALAAVRGLMASRLPVDLDDAEQRRGLVAIIDGVVET